MYPYTKKLTLDEALKFISLELELTVYSSFSKATVRISQIINFDVKELYPKGAALYCTALHYATHILGQVAPPEGWGYPSNELKQGTYTNLQWAWYNGDCWNINELDNGDGVYYDTSASLEPWNTIAFRLEDLARVEVVAETEKTEINAAQIEWLLAYPSINKHWVNGKEYMCLSIVDVGNAGCAGIKYEILTSDYNSLPDEFKALAEPKSKAPSYVEFICDKIEATDWKAKYEAQASEIAKFVEIWAENASLKIQLLEATQSADLKQDKIHDLEHYKSISDNYIKALEAKLNAIEVLTSAQWNLAKARNDYYPF